MTGVRILIIDDNLLSANRLKDKLKGIGYSIGGIATSGEDALQQLLEISPDLVLMDIELEDSQGVNQITRKINELASIPVIYLTAFTDTGDLQRAKISAPYGYITKPYEETSLLSTIEIGLHKHALEKELKKAEEQYRTIVENSPIGIIMFNADYHLVFANENACIIFGYDRDELIGNDLRGFLTNESSRNLKLHERLNRSEESAPPPFEAYINRKDRQIRCIEIYSSRTGDSNGQNLTIAQILDITDRRASDAALKHSESRYRQVVELSPMLIAIQKPHKITYLNRAGANILGLQDPKDAIGHSLLEYIQREDRQELYERFFKLAQAEKPLPLIEQAIIRPDGTRVELEVSATVTHQDDETIVQVIAWDITERKMIQEALRRQAALADIELAINQPHELQSVLDRVAKITTQLLPASGGASVALWDELSRDFWISSSTVQEPMKNLIDRQIRKPGSASRWILKNKKPVITPDVSKDRFGPNQTLTKYNFLAYVGVPLVVEEEVLGVLFVLDVHTRQYTNDDLDFLAALANRAALAIAKVRLVSSLEQARSTAEETARARDQFLANMSHELRTPLTAVVSSAELLQVTNLGQRQKELVQTTRASANKLLTLINDILDFSKLEAEKVSLETRPFDLRGCIEDALDLVTMEARRKKLNLSYHVADAVPSYILGDAKRLGQVLTNLLNNAVKFTKSGEVTLNVRLKPPTAALLESSPSSKDVLELLFSVKDTGIGIDPEKIGILFTPFKQLDASTTRKYGGTGLGLAISKQLVQLMGGNIWAESSGIAGEGTTFTFTIRAKSTTAPLAPYLQANPPQLQGKRVLLITKSDNQRQVMADMLKYWGIRVFSFDTDESALSWLKPSQIIDLMILGAGVPAEKNIELINELYRRIDSTSIPLIIISIDDQIEQMELPFKISGLIKTPIKPEPLYNLLNSVFSTPDHQIELQEDIVPEVTPAAIAHPLNILIAEDDPTNQYVIAMMLTHLGYQPVLTNNGIEVIRALENKRFDVVLMDLQMPEMDGLTTTRYIRSSMPMDKQPYIIALTADARQEARDAMFSEGVNEYLTKPVHQNMLAQALDYAIKNQQSDDFLRVSPGGQEMRTRTDGTPIDESIIDDFMTLMGEDSKDALAELFDTFLDNTPKLVQEMKTASSEGNWRRVRWTAHTLKGNCELLGGVQLVQMCRELISQIDNQSTAQVSERVDQIEVEFAGMQTLIRSKREFL